MPTFPRIRPYKTFAVAADDTRTPVRTHELVLERPVGVDLEINLAPHPGFRGQVSFSTFRGSSLIIEPAASNVAYVFIEDWPVGDRRRKIGSKLNSRGTLGHVYLVDGRWLKQATDDRTFAVEVGPGKELLIELAPRAPWARHVKISSSTDQLCIRLNASNIVMFSAED
ncbi:MAG: hypothetical protein HOW73_22380 [Polyangiaceae bacterium]|nr:hypothetical protein [Polyangiaceae bacterium]